MLFLTFWEVILTLTGLFRAQTSISFDGTYHFTLLCSCG